MRSYPFQWLLILFCGAYLASCGHVPHDQDGRWVASWYGEPFHGRKTASGEVYNMYENTAAHKTLPMGTRLRVTYPVTGKSVIVTVNDRGPFVRGRDLDLSLGAARSLGMVEAGVVQVDVNILGSARNYDVENPVGTSGIFLQAASFKSQQKARQLGGQLGNLSRPHRILQATSGGHTVYRILVGPYPNRRAAETDRNQLTHLGLSPIFREFY